MKKIKILEVSKDAYIPHTYGKFTIKKGDIIEIKVKELIKK